MSYIRFAPSVVTVSAERFSFAGKPSRDPWAASPYSKRANASGRSIRRGSLAEEVAGTHMSEVVGRGNTGQNRRDNGPPILRWPFLGGYVDEAAEEASEQERRIES
jgi:hypothetical protein